MLFEKAPEVPTKREPYPGRRIERLPEQQEEEQSNSRPEKPKDGSSLGVASNIYSENLFCDALYKSAEK